jgi:hypothetical protein
MRSMDVTVIHPICRDPFNLFDRHIVNAIRRFSALS